MSRGKAIQDVPAWRKPMVPSLIMNALSVVVMLVFLWLWAASNQKDFPAGLALAFCLAFYCVVSMYTFIDQFRRNRLFSYVIDGERTSFPLQEQVYLYLRSFDGDIIHSRKLFRRKIFWLFLEMVFGGVRIWRRSADPEWTFHEILSDHGTFVAVGDKFGTYGAIKIRSTDREWRRKFTWCCDRACVILCQIDSSSGSVWEIQQLLRSEALRSKSLFFLPVDFDKERYYGAQAACSGFGLALPEYDERGWVVRVSENRSLNEMTSYLAFIDAAQKNGGDLLVAFRNSGPLPTDQYVEKNKVVSLSVAEATESVLRRLAWTLAMCASIVVVGVILHLFVAWAFGVRL